MFTSEEVGTMETPVLPLAMLAPPVARTVSAGRAALVVPDEAQAPTERMQRTL